MPLPTNGSISLQGHSRPGEGVTTKPKLAMIVRMTEETLDALQNLSTENRMEFEFGDHPGIHIQNTFFPMRFNKEKENHELFIRTTTSVKPNTPLRLNANVIGKFNVERDLSEKLSRQIQEASAAAAKQKTERKTIMLDKPPVTAATSQKAVTAKRKVPTKATAPKVMTVKNYTTPTSTSGLASSSSSSLSDETVLQLRQRLVHYLALGPATVADILKSVGGVEAEWDVKRKITELLNEVAEEVPTGHKSTASASKDTKWQLKPRVWLEVRPYQYPDYTDNVRTSVARYARSWLSSLKVPETDPAWEHVKFRSSSSGSGAASAAGQTRAVNGMTGAAAKERAKTNTKSKEAKAKSFDIKAKSEAVRPTTQSVPTTKRQSVPTPSAASTGTNGWNGKAAVSDMDPEREEGEISQSNTPPRAVNTPPVAPPPRRPPGSRQTLAPPSSTPHPPRPTTPQPTPSPSHSSTVTVPAPPKRTGPVDARGPRRPPPEPSERARAAPPIPPPAPVEKKPIVTVSKEKASPPVSREKDRERDREVVVKREKEKESDRESLRGRAREREIVKRERERESDLESVRAVKYKREPESDLEEMILERHKERERGRKKEKAARAARERERLREEAALEDERAAQRKERLREKQEAAERAAEKAERAERIRAKEAAAIASSKKKRKQPEYTDDDESSDWGIEDRKREKLLASSTTKKVRQFREDVSAVSSKPSTSTLKSRRELTPPLKRIKREPSPLPPSPRRVTTKSSNASASSSRETSQSLKTKIKDRDYDRDLERAVPIRDRERDRDRDRDYSSRVTNGSNGVSKKRRQPEYTSSSEEEEDEKPLNKVVSKMSRKAPVSSPHVSQTPSTSTSRNRSSHISRPPASSQPLPSPSDHDSLRSRYSTTYIAYINVFQKLCSQKAKISAMLNRRSGSVSAESDADVEMLSPEELEDLKSQHKRLHEELESIARIYAQ